ncbi:hypothetical protein HOD20_04265 [archaeon]|jgi:thiazole/oxazole-forming peptide maturase SagD family component|nr:hypothetical protein [archaeon]
MISKKEINTLKQIGITSNEKEMILLTDEPKIPGFLCFTKDNIKEKYNVEEAFGQGFHPKENEARIKSVAECLERLCMNNPLEEFIIMKKENNTGFIDPRNFCNYSNKQLTNKEDFLEECLNSEYRWSKAKDILTNKEVYLPSQVIYLSSHFNDEFPIRQERISTGCAFGQKGTTMAFENGLLEALERDACIYSYLTKREIKKITNLPKSSEELVKYFNRYNLESQIFDVATDLGVPTALAITIDRTGIGAAVNVGSSASFNYSDAIQRALLESVQCRRNGRLMQIIECKNGLPKEHEITSMDNRFYYWHGIERIEDLDFWLNSEKSISYNTLRKNNTSLDKTLELLKKNNFNVYVSDISLPEVSEAGFEALKVMIPELHPLYLSEESKFLYSKHYGEIKEDLSLKPHPLT